MVSGLILVVDDTPANLEVICQTLVDAGYSVTPAIDGDRALKRVQTNPPDLILLDVMMPGINGFETCQQLKANPITASIPVIFMTALADIESKVKGFAAGGVDYITKPFQEQEVLARVQTHLQLRQLAHRLEQTVAERTIELTNALEQLHQSQLHLIQSEKMSALGNLVAGVAHEINNPINFIAGNIPPAQSYINDLFHLIHLYQQELPHPSTALQSAIVEADLDYVQDDLPKLLASMQVGIDRIRNISISLRTFSRADSDRPVAFDLHEGIDSTLLMLKHRLKANEFRNEIVVVYDYGEIPDVECYPGQLNQVFMNLLSNAIDALDEASQKYDRDLQSNLRQITICTQFSNSSQVQVKIRDNGCGMADAVRQRIFDALFTTKEVGKGTGLGLAIVHQIVVEKHGGTIHVNSNVGEGTEFVVTLPISRVSASPEVSNLKACQF